MASDQLIAHESELAKLEEQRVQNLDGQATAIVSVVLAIAAFSASAVDTKTIESEPLPVGLVGLFVFLAVGFAVAARGPRATRTRFWTVVDQDYARLERRLAKAEQHIAGNPSDEAIAVLESWRARRAVSSHIAEGKALWVSYSLLCLLVAFIAAGAASLIIVG
ncbi:MAG: hypothetical protein QOD83_1913 [Solirubrobacteraceae bacterium]|jgi:hypothetical protein|nr:hypothetical protein [Solirubrobacteraceae bacterium]